MLMGIILLLSLFIYSKNDLYFGSYNINAVLGLGTGLGFIALGQTIVLMTGVSIYRWVQLREFC